MGANTWHWARAQLPPSASAQPCHKSLEGLKSPGTERSGCCISQSQSLPWWLRCCCSFPFLRRAEGLSSSALPPFHALG